MKRLAFVLATTVTAVGAAGAAGPAPVTSPGGSRALAASTSHIAWIDASWRLHVRGQTSGRESIVGYTKPSLVAVAAPWTEQPGLVFAGSRPMWTDVRGGSSELETVYASDRSGRVHALGRYRHRATPDDTTGDYLLAVAGGSAGGLYSWAHEIATANGGGRTTGGEIVAVANGVARTIPHLPAAVALARSGRRIALAPMLTGENDGLPGADDAHPTVTIAAVDGAAVTTFAVRYPVSALALTPRFLFVFEAQIYGPHHGTEIRSATTGKLLRWLPGRGSVDLAASGRYLAFADYSKVFVVDGATGKIARVAVVRSIRSQIVQVAAAGRTMWWAFRTRTPGSHGNVDDPADFTTTIVRRTLGTKS